jgi:hypothetical protein
VTTVSEHYDRHLGPVYSWMHGDLQAALARGGAELRALGIERSESLLYRDSTGQSQHANDLAHIPQRRGAPVERSTKSTNPTMNRLR